MSRKIFDRTIQVDVEARNSIRGQRHRCNNRNASDYKYYGAKGIRVEYSSEDFLTWFRKERTSIPLNIKVSVDRIDHNKNYTLDNIKLVTRSENIAEMNTRTKSKKVMVYDLDTMTPLVYFDSGSHCSAILGHTPTTISKHCRNKPIKSRYSNSITFRFL